MASKEKSKHLKIAFDSRSVLVAYAFTLVKNWSTAQDLFQDSVINLVEKNEPIEKPVAWLKKVIKNKSVDLIRKEQRTKTKNEQLGLLVEREFDSAITNEKNHLYKEKEQALQSCMAKLDRESQEIILSFYKSKTPCAKLAEIYNRSTNAIRLTLSRSRNSLRHCVKSQMSSL